VVAASATPEAPAIVFRNPRRERECRFSSAHATNSSPPHMASPFVELADANEGRTVDPAGEHLFSVRQEIVAANADG
jgi:hypothetical protein